jgi:hypothetical protein
LKRFYRYRGSIGVNPINAGGFLNGVKIKNQRPPAEQSKALALSRGHPQTPPALLRVADFLLYKYIVQKTENQEKNPD